MANDANRQADPVDQLIEMEYAEEENKSFLPSISSKLATTVTHWCHNVPDREKIKKAFKNTLIPDNVEGLLPVRINEILYQRMSFRSKMNDQHLRGINSFVTRGLGPVAAVLDQVLKMEANLAMSECTVEIDGGCLLIGKDRFDIHHLCQLLDQSVYILAICYSVCLQKRKSQLRECLDKKYHYLTKPSNKVTEDLLGPNLEQKISDSNCILSAAKKFGRFQRGQRLGRNFIPTNQNQTKYFGRSAFAGNTGNNVSNFSGTYRRQGDFSQRRGSYYRGRQNNSYIRSNSNRQTKRAKK